MVFARETGTGLTSLVKQLDAAVGKNKAANMRGFVVMLTDSDKAEGQLKALAEKEGVKNVSLAVDNPTGPPSYKIAKDADIVVVFYKNKKVVVNHAFKKGEINDKAIAQVVADVPKILN
jgi:hypothetical protein